jgi:hypothetical protein
MAKKMQEDADREERILMEIVVDAYDEYERYMGWCCYLGDTMSFPFTAVCTVKRANSPLKTGETVQVVGIATESDLETEIYVRVEWNGDLLDVPLSQLEAPEGDTETKQAIADWHYWVDQGYTFR